MNLHVFFKRHFDSRNSTGGNNNTRIKQLLATPAPPPFLMSQNRSDKPTLNLFCFQTQSHIIIFVVSKTIMWLIKSLSTQTQDNSCSLENLLKHTVKCTELGCRFLIFWTYSIISVGDYWVNKASRELILFSSTPNIIVFVDKGLEAKAVIQNTAF